VLAEAIRFNAPLRRTASVGESFASVDDPNLVLDTIKPGVLRLYEAHGARGTARVRFACERARFANALEEPLEDAVVEDGAIVVPYRPHQVITVLVD
jgi:alpha-mannosidase